MIVRENRFHGYSSLRFVYRNGQTVRGPLVALKFIRNSRQKSWRAAVVVSRKVSKSAVVRNRIRRRIYEIIRQREALLNQPFDMVFIVFSPQLTELDSGKMEETIVELFNKAAILDTPPSTLSADQHDIVETKEK